MTEDRPKSSALARMVPSRLRRTSSIPFAGRLEVRRTVAGLDVEGGTSLPAGGNAERRARLSVGQLLGEVQLDADLVDRRHPAVNAPPDDDTDAANARAATREVAHAMGTTDVRPIERVVALDWSFLDTASARA